MPISITLHAIDRYIDRIDPTASAKSAREHILRAATTAVRSREKTSTGHTYYIADDIRLVMAEEQGNLVVVTVLEKHEQSQGETEEVPELAVKLATEFDSDSAQKLLTQPQAERKEKEQTARERVAFLEELLRKRNAEIKALNAQLSARKGISTEQYEALERRYERQLMHGVRMVEDRLEAKRILGAFLVASVRGGPLPLEIIEEKWPGWIDAIMKNA